ncbi:MAG: ATP-binding protein, partial [Myxococcota bacterium]
HDLHESRQRINYLQKVSAWQEFAKRLAHEIKNPLTPIQLAVQEVHESYGGADARFYGKLADARTIVEEEVSTLRRLVGEFSAFAKLPEAQLEAADLRDFLAEVSRSAPAILEDFGVSEQVYIEFIDSGDSIPVCIDAMMLKRCVDNLLRNAVQSIAAKGSGRVWVRAHVEGPSVLLRVEDDGPGIPEADRQRVFDPYYTTRDEGTGLGLAIVKKIILEHHGKIQCLASDQGGALLQIHLPLYR